MSSDVGLVSDSKLSTLPFLLGSQQNRQFNLFQDL
ncbi:hypothetical protein K227x_54810 [Rubripirellula lacrimiformis]|uniref:Uncharacterized protein n=1 Tax=Rubripirellula lacrimiformis TaxID=1930273 RepID=A0A517NIU1_9BACT|nr:hypothetical protein K227x_54810 [Rubripirellula lacrimiformis]